MNADFDPRYPPTSNSLNRLRLEAASVPDALRGQWGYTLLSAQTLKMLIEPYTPDVAIFYEETAREADWAVKITTTLGTRLGTLLLTLLRNDAQTQQANAEKPAGFWDYWSGVQTVYLGGGMLRGRVGQLIAAQAQTTLQSLAQEPAYRVIRAEHPQMLPLLGAARTIQTGQRACVLDFGGSYVKRAIAHYTPEGLRRMQILDSLPSNFPADAALAQDVFERMVEIIARSYADADALTIAVSIASYVDAQGQPLLTQGGLYMNLARLTQNLPAALSQAVSEHLGKTLQVRVLHDCTSAALFFSPTDYAAVMMIGTALGAGYPVSRPNLNLRPVSQELTVED
jgi:hypothetical protein